MKGQGKSHYLLVVHHIFASPDVAKPWIESHGYPWTPPKDVIVVVEKFTDQYLPFDSLWTYLGEKLGVAWPEHHAPSLGEFRTAVGDRHLVLIFDELERGVNNILDANRRSQNLSFLQMISEEANRSPNVTLVAAIYSGAVEPGITLKRINRLELRFRKAEERAAIVRHRLFSNASSYDRKAADDLIQSYINTWRRVGVQVMDEYVTRLKSSFPFLPELIDLIFERLGGGEAFQGTRGALGLIGAMLDASGAETKLITGAHCRLTDSACADRLQDLDPAGTTISCATGNLRDLSRQPYAEAIASATLLASLVPGRARGLTKDELVRHVAEPGFDPNQFEVTLEAFRRYGSYFHKEEDRFYFDIEENEEAKVELEALRAGSDDAARQEIARLWLAELFKESQQAVVHTDFDATRTALSGMSKRGPRFVLAPRRLSGPERHNLYQGAEYRNQILLLEPREDQANHMVNPDILTAARRYTAARNLAAAPRTNAERRDRYEKIALRERKLILDTLKQAGLVYIRIEKWDETSERTTFEIESVGQASTREDVVNFLRTQVYPQTYFAEHIRERLPSFTGQSVEQVDRIYRTTLGFPVPLKEDMISGAILFLVEDRDAPALGLRGPRGRSFCGELVDLTASDLDAAILSAPWPRATTPPPVQRPLPISSEQPSDSTSDVSVPPPTPIPPAVDTDELATPFSRSLGELRQQIAARLVDIDGAGIQRVSFRILVNAQDTELSGFSAGVRGSLSGRGSLDVQLELTCPGPMTKAEVEAKSEQLPQLPQGTYAARLWVVRKRGEAA
ncbi:MAG TPA: hypothetical protein VNO43_08895 [Candidatus Eisenbacteria bacterium]|nr:hypothetical protein [Candidatus Eisenbacteria bacterium]